MGLQATSMPRLIAFLRAINVSGHTVKMDHLRQLFESLGLLNVETFIASGNVIFDSPDENVQALEKQIESHLHESLGYAVATFIRSSSELASVANYQPFAASQLEGNALYIAFLPAAPNHESQQKVMAFQMCIRDRRFRGRKRAQAAGSGA